jgi:hypothetical protein
MKKEKRKQPMTSRLIQSSVEHQNLKDIQVALFYHQSLISSLLLYAWKENHKSIYISLSN